MASRIEDEAFDKRIWSKIFPISVFITDFIAVFCFLDVVHIQTRIRSIVFSLSELALRLDGPGY